MKDIVKKFNELSDDIIEDIFDIDVDKDNQKIEIESIIDVFLEPNDAALNESGLVALNADLTNKDVKRGDVIYITAFTRKPGTSFSSPATQSVIKLRIIDIYQGLAYLNKLLK